MSGLGWSALDQTEHELAQRPDVERAVLHFVDDEIVVCLGELEAGVEAVAALSAGVVDRLPIGEQLDRLIQALRLVVRVAALRP